MIPSLFCLALTAALTLMTGCGGPNQQIASASHAPAVDYLWRMQLSWGKTYWEMGHFEFGEVTVSADGTTLFVGSRLGDLYAIRTIDGSVIWQHTFTESFSARPLLARGKLFVGGGDGVMRAIQANNGELLWEYDSGGAIQATPALEDERLVFTNSLDRIFAVDIRSGDYLWQKARPTKPPEFALHGHSGVLIHEGVAYAGFSDGQLMAYSLEDGATIWGHDLAPGQRRFRDVDTTPVVIDDVLYAASFTGGLHAFDIKKEYRRRWHRELEGASEVSDGGGSVMYFSSNEGVHATDRRTGLDFWHLPLGEEALPSRPVIADSSLVVSLRRRGLLLIKRSDGTPRATINPGGGFSAAPTVAGPIVFVVSNRGGLYALRTFP